MDDLSGYLSGGICRWSLWSQWCDRGWRLQQEQALPSLLPWGADEENQGKMAREEVARGRQEPVAYELLTNINNS